MRRKAKTYQERKFHWLQKVKAMERMKGNQKSRKNKRREIQRDGGWRLRSWKNLRSKSGCADNLKAQSKKNWVIYQLRDWPPMDLQGRKRRNSSFFLWSPAQLILFLKLRSVHLPLSFPWLARLSSLPPPPTFLFTRHSRSQYNKGGGGCILQLYLLIPVFKVIRWLNTCSLRERLRKNKFMN